MTLDDVWRAAAPHLTACSTLNDRCATEENLTDVVMERWKDILDPRSAADLAITYQTVVLQRKAEA